MISSVLDPREPKSEWDIIVLGTLAIHIGLFFYLERPLQQYVMLALFIFWRFAYDAGLGYLLHVQSCRRQIVIWTREWHLFDKKGYPARTAFVRRQLQGKMGKDYSFENSPAEFNSWLLFRRLVDLVLLEDFVAYVLFAASWIYFPPQHGNFLHMVRWCFGLLISAFNIWVKIDAHRVVKDYAWYWGDFFFLVDQSLTFDGVFEMAPHPMYSVGYAFYYGVSLIACSYTVLFVSLFAHALQFVFLALVENPHIDKTYGSENPKAKVHSSETNGIGSGNSAVSIADAYGYEGADLSDSSDTDDMAKSGLGPSRPRDLVILKNFDIFRAMDFSLAANVLYVILVGVLWSMPEQYLLNFLIGQALFWRFIHSVVLGIVLRMQSQSKAWTRHFIRRGGTAVEAFTQWKGLYNMTLTLTYMSFFVVCARMYELPDQWLTGLVLLRHTMGVLLCALHAWTAWSVHEVLGNFGWFYGDFFLWKKGIELRYHGIYRYMNNPELIMGSLTFWGMAFITPKTCVILLALFSHLCNMLYMRYVELPHMEKLYGDSRRKEAGLTRGLKKVLKRRDSQRSFEST